MKLIISFLTIALFPISVSAQELPPVAIYLGQTIEQNDGSLFKNAVRIENFKCLAHGKNWQWVPACDYYKASVIGKAYTSEPTREICFKEFSRVSNPRNYFSNQNYKIVFEDQPRENFYSKEKAPIGRIISVAPLLKNDARLSHQKDGQIWHETTSVFIYDCKTPYDGKSFN